MVQTWNDLTFIHWPFDPEVVAERLPPGLVPDVWDGQAWVGLVPFKMNNIRMPWTPPIPTQSSFPETNIRTYVRGPNGRDGVFFLSLDINRLAATVVARTTYRLPYMWSSMSIEQRPNGWRYRQRRRWPSLNLHGEPVTEPNSDVEVRIGTQMDPGLFDHYLTGRWGLWTELRRGLSYAPVEHPAWPLFDAEVLSLDETLFAAAGLPKPIGAPIVHYSPGVTVRIGVPKIHQPT